MHWGLRRIKFLEMPDCQESSRFHQERSVFQDPQQSLRCVFLKCNAAFHLNIWLYN